MEKPSSPQGGINVLSSQTPEGNLSSEEMGQNFQVLFSEERHPKKLAIGCQCLEIVGALEYLALFVLEYVYSFPRGK